MLVGVDLLLIAFALYNCPSVFITCIPSHSRSIRLVSYRTRPVSYPSSPLLSPFCSPTLLGTATSPISHTAPSAQSHCMLGMCAMNSPGGGTPVATVAATAIAATAVLALLRWALYPHRVKAITSPLRSILPQLSSDQIAQLEYPPDIFPGARDVTTPVSGFSPSSMPVRVPFPPPNLPGSMAPSVYTSSAPSLAARS